MIRLVLLLCASLLAGGCHHEESATAPKGPQYEARPTLVLPTYRLAVHPLYNPLKLTLVYQPLVDHLNATIPEAHFELEASRDYQAYEEKIRQRHTALLLPNPWQTLQAMKVGYRVIAMAGDPAEFRGLFIVRRDSDIQTVGDLKGRVVSYPSYTAMAACIMPQWYLHTQGLDVQTQTTSHYVGSQESAILNVLLGESAVGVTWPPPWRQFVRDRPRDAAQLKVIWETPPLLSNAVMVRDDMPEALALRVRTVLLGLHQEEAGRALLRTLETSRFHPADDRSYAVVEEFITQFEHEVRLVTTP